MDLTFRNFKVHAMWPYRFPHHPVHHGPHGAATVVTRPTFKIAKWRGGDGHMVGWNFWLYLPSRTYAASFGYGRTR